MKKLLVILAVTVSSLAIAQTKPLGTADCTAADIRYGNWWREGGQFHQYVYGIVTTPQGGKVEGVAKCQAATFAGLGAACMAAWRLEYCN